MEGHESFKKPKLAPHSSSRPTLSSSQPSSQRHRGSYNPRMTTQDKEDDKWAPTDIFSFGMFGVAVASNRPWSKNKNQTGIIKPGRASVTSDVPRAGTARQSYVADEVWLVDTRTSTFCSQTHLSKSGSEPQAFFSGFPTFPQQPAPGISLLR
jgi:hypothetical protein